MPGKPGGGPPLAPGGGKGIPPGGGKGSPLGGMGGMPLGPGGNGGMGRPRAPGGAANIRKVKHSADRWLETYEGRQGGTDPVGRREDQREGGYLLVGQSMSIESPSAAQRAMAGRERALPPGKGNGGGKLWPGWFCGSIGLLWAWPSAA